MRRSRSLHRPLGQMAERIANPSEHGEHGSDLDDRHIETLPFPSELPKSASAGAQVVVG